MVEAFLGGFGVRALSILAALFVVVATGCTSGDGVDDDLVERAQQRLTEVRDPSPPLAGVGDLEDVDHCPLWFDQKGSMTIEDETLMCLVVDDDVIPLRAGMLFVYLESNGSPNYDTFIAQMTSEGRWAVDRVEVDSSGNKPRIDSVCRVLDPASLPIKPRKTAVDQVCVAEFSHADLVIVYLEINPIQTDSPAMTLSEQLTPTLERLAALDPDELGS